MSIDTAYNSQVNVTISVNIQKGHKIGNKKITIPDILNRMNVGKKTKFTNDDKQSFDISFDGYVITMMNGNDHEFSFSLTEKKHAERVDREWYDSKKK